MTKNPLPNVRIFFFFVLLVPLLRANTPEHPVVSELLSKGSAQSIYQLGMLYRNGLLVVKDVELGLGYIAEASEMGSADASTELGKMYHYGIYVEKNIDAAREWYEKGRQQGSAQCSLGLGDIYGAIHKEVEEPDYAAALGYYQEAVERGSGMAHIAIGNLYLHGRGVKQNARLAEVQYLQAISKGERGGHTLIFSMIDQGKLPNRSMQQAFEHLENAAAKGDARAAYYMGKAKLEGGWQRYESEEIVPYAKDIAGGMALLNASMEKRVPGAYLYAADLYRNGKLVNKDIEKSVSLLNMAAEYTPKGNEGAVRRVRTVIEDMFTNQEVSASKAAEIKARLSK